MWMNDKIKSLVQQNFRVWHYSMTHDMMSRPIHFLILSQIKKILFKIFKQYKHGHSSNLINFFPNSLGVESSNCATRPYRVVGPLWHYSENALRACLQFIPDFKLKKTCPKGIRIISLISIKHYIGIYI